VFSSPATQASGQIGRMLCPALGMPSEAESAAHIPTTEALVPAATKALVETASIISIGAEALASIDVVA
jgi:hypothetical protein